MNIATLIACIILDCATGAPVDLETLAGHLATRDLVFLGEEHDNTAGHEMHLRIIEALHARRSDLVISMEMFERDVQGVLDDYLRGRIDEETFLEHARPWPNYREHYRPMIEFARARGLDVLAANVPRSAARAVASGKGGRSDHAARSTSAPKDRYWEAFGEAMKDHPGEVSEKAMEAMYAAQCLKDDTMAESIVDYLEGRPYRRPLVIHVCGKFHSDHGLGTVVRVLERRPLTQVAVLGMLSREDVEAPVEKRELTSAHFLLVVPSEPKPEEPEEGEVVAASEEAASTEAEAPGEAAPAALGILPDYEVQEGGVLVGGLSPGGAAEKCGLLEGDMIVRIGEEPVESLEDYMSVMAELRAGMKVAVTVVREGEEKVVEVVLGRRRR